jgi:phospho-N-acetylmuramoyl-pentapeptide-transferase
MARGILVTAVLSLVLVGTVLTVDSYIWKVIRRPLAHYFLTVPFCIAAAASAYFGTICVPLLKRLKAQQVFRIEGPAAHQSKVGTPTMGGVYFVPIGVGVARLVTGSWPHELWGVCVATLAFAAIGFVDDWLALWRKHNYGMPGSLKFLLQVHFILWLQL